MATTLDRPAGGKDKDVKTAPRKFNVGGVWLNQPFKVRRLGHFGMYVHNVEECYRFYHDLMGFRITDVLDAGERIKDKEKLKGIKSTKAYFTTHCGDHHSFVLMNGPIYEMMAETYKTWPEVRVNQISWQVGSLKEIVDGANWFTELDLKINRSGRDMPGSNWHTYPYDPEGHKNEIFYGMEQVGWDGYSKPYEMHVREFRKTPDLPQITETTEVENAMAEGLDLLSGYRDRENLPKDHEVDGVLLARPFRIVRHGPVRLFVEDVAAVTRFYTDVMGFSISEEVTWQGHRCVFLRCNLEHHSMALYPLAMRESLPVRQDSTLFSFGLQVANYRQLRDAVAFLEGHGCKFVDIPQALYPGIDYSAFVVDPEGHLMQLYYYMEQVGWDGTIRPASQRRKVVPGEWPEALEPMSDTYAGEPFMGPF